MTQFKDIENYEGMYQVSSDGRIMSLGRFVVNGRKGRKLPQYVPPCERKCSLHGTGYLTIRLANQGVVCTHRVHRLVAKAFIPNPLGLPFVNHINGDKTDNRVENLEWCTPGENTMHAVRTGLLINERDTLTGRFIPKSLANKEDCSSESN